MRFLVSIVLVAALMGGRALAQEEEEGGKSMMEQGMELFFKGLRDEMSPTLRDLQGLADQFGPEMQEFLREMGPALARLMTEVKDWSRYEAPEMLPNGDIIIRRKPDDEPEDKPEDKLPPAGPTDI